MPTINLWLPCTQKIVNMLLNSHESNKYFLREYYLIPILLKKKLVGISHILLNGTK